MKTFVTASLITTSLAACVFAQSQSISGNLPAVTTSTPTDYKIIWNDANSRVWRRETYEKTPDGTLAPRVHQYTELAAGMYYRDEKGAWKESKEDIETFPGGAIARQGQYQVIFANNLNTSGSIDMQLPDGKRLKSNILGLAYYDNSTGQTTMIAEIQDSQGELISTNQVLYPDAFKGTKADVRYTYQRGSFEQDVILHEQPPEPEAYGLNPETTEIEVVTEFLNPPKETLKENGAGDSRVSWGAMFLGSGKAFDLSGRRGARVSKQYVTVDGRKILVEKVRLSAMTDAITELPLHAGRSQRHMHAGGKALALPKPLLAQSGDKPMRIASFKKPDSGYVLDYVQLVSTYLTNFTFQADATYYITGTHQIDGTATIEGGAVIKYATTGFPSVWIYGTLDCEASAYRPAIFTSIDDNSVGETISGSTGSPSVSSNSEDLYLEQFAPNYTLNNLRICYAWYGVEMGTLNPVNIWDCQFLRCYNPLEIIDTNVFLHNILIAECANANSSSYANPHWKFMGENVTIVATNLWASGTHLYGPTSINLTNSIIVASIPGTTTYNTNQTVINPGGTIFQTVGGGAYYLATNSVYRDAGTTNMNPDVLAHIAQKTTCPPIVYAGVSLTAPQTFSPQANRDDDTPDLGYHYDPLDYVFGGCTLSTNITCMPGTAIGWYEVTGGTYASGQPYGICLNNGGNLSCTGTVTAPCWGASYNAVQESINGNWTGRGYMGGLVLNGSGSTGQPIITTRFTKLSSIQGMANFWRDNWAYGLVNCTHTEFYSGGIGSYRPSMYFTNCLLFRVSTTFWDQMDAASFTFQNCTFYNGVFAFSRTAGQSSSFWTVRDTAFDGTAFSWGDNLSGNTNSTYFDYNAYNTNNVSWQTYPFPYPPTYGTLETVGAHDLFVGGYDWQESFFGEFYLPSGSPLVDAGDTTADQLQLYHFTTQTDQTVESTSPVDIGYHYVATDSYGNPLDSDGDGIPDYLEDANGNGLVDSGETDWQNALDTGLQVRILRPRQASTLP